MSWRRVMAGVSLALVGSTAVSCCGRREAPARLKESYALAEKRGSGKTLFVASAAKRRSAPALAELKTIGATITSEELEANVRKLSSWRSRHSRSSTIHETESWIESEFRGFGYTDIAFEAITTNDVTGRNVVCTKLGSDPALPILVVGAHFDSRAATLADPDAHAPGADDNASGVAAVLACARAIAKIKTARSVQFVCFCGEEQGLFGSMTRASSMYAEATPIRWMLNLDMVGFPPPADRSVTVERDEGNAVQANDRASYDAAERMATIANDPFGLTVRFGPIYSSDYMPFESRGYVTLGLFEGGENPNYHLGTDRPATLDYAWLRDISASVTAFVVEEARVP